jgi:uncharacterized protein (TIGR03067 family)
MRIHSLLPIALYGVALAAFSAAGVAPSARAAEPALTGDLAKLQGQWTAMFGRDKNIPMVVTVKGTSVTLSITRSDGQPYESKGEIKIDETAKPHKTIDWTKFIGRNGTEAPANLGIYVLNGDSCTFCNGGPGHERQTEFKASEGGPQQLITLNRKTAATGASELTGDLAKLQGRWTGKGGRERNSTVIVTITGTSVAFSRTTAEGQQRESKGEIKIDETARPHKTIDWVNFTTPRGDKAPASLAIYRLDGDTLTICSGGAGNDRPGEFKAGEGGRPSLIELRRD